MTTIISLSNQFIDGEWVNGSGPRLTVESPATGEPITEVSTASPEQFSLAIEAARRAFDSGPWAMTSPAERIAFVRRFGAALLSRRDLLVETVIAETGCPRSVAEIAQVDMALSSIVELCDLYAAMPEWEHNEVPLDQYVSGAQVRLSIRRFEPTGVVAAITPYNFPFITNVWKVVPALLAGCTVVLRPSPLTPLEALVMGEAAAEANFPPGILNIVVEPGSEGAMLMTTDPFVDVVSFTGSTDVGRAVAAQSAPTLKRVILELGGKSVALHLPDAMSDGMAGVVGGALTVFGSHAGQGCALQTRVLVPNEYRESAAEAIAQSAGLLPIGDPTSQSTLIGPLISSHQRRRVDELVKASVAAGARCVRGGNVPEGMDHGWFYEPTVLDAPDPSNPANQNEFFGPVVSVLGYRDLEDAIAIANSTDYGLSGGIYTSDLALGMKLARQFRSGTVQINTGLAAGFTPMGGYKQSGYGRERGSAGIRAFQELKHIVVGSR